ncbi:hypothetical protein FK220_008105 [Flavobacteriaceae bacterium TP-CH-4]|uniref:YbbR-like protein n=1 Tax=Pelagihabitans pacificus TaxID=2696054 RepID=A0A967E6L6_9FLAO|nr:hypothetical protein [Pelagihabitans pacificus]NHF59299.1 hypothetical protein [Pelagihabitans pacificus]
MMLVNASKKEIELKLEAVGFQFLAFNLRSQNLNIDLSEAIREDGIFYISPTDCRRQLEKQLPTGVQLLDTDGDSLFFKFYKVVSKKVPVIARTDLSFPQNYLMEGALKIVPDSVIVKGPENEVDTITAVRTAKTTLTDLTSDFLINSRLTKEPHLENTEYATETVEISGKVSRFSEKVIPLSITVVNLPEGVAIQLFPEKVEVLVKASLDRLKDLNADDFQVIADYASLPEQSGNSFKLKLVKKPGDIYSVVLLQDRADFILKRE